MQEDDLVLDLPPLDGPLEEESAEEGSSRVAEDEELESRDEEVGLDDREAEDLVGVSSELDIEEEDAGAVAWTELSDAFDDVDEIDEAEEEGWLDDRNGEDEPNDDEDFGDEDTGVREDRGEEGFAETEGGGEGDDIDPALEAIHAVGDLDADAEDLDIDRDALIEDGLIARDEPRAERVALPSVHDPAALRVDFLGPEADGIAALSIGEEGQLFAVGKHLYALEGEKLVARAGEGPAADAASWASIARDPLSPSRMYLGAVDGSVWTSEDRGQHLRPAPHWSAGEAGRIATRFRVMSQAYRGGVRLWGLTDAGTLMRSDDLEAGWSGPLLLAHVVAFAIEGEEILVLCAGRRGALELGRSVDGGFAWTMKQLPIQSARDRSAWVATLGSHIAVTTGDDGGECIVSSDGGESWRSLGSLHSGGPLAWIEEDGAPVLYRSVFVEGRDRGLVVRQPPDAAPTVVLDLAREPGMRALHTREEGDGEGRIQALVASAGAEGTDLWVATPLGLFRVLLRRASAA